MRATPEQRAKVDAVLLVRSGLDEHAAASVAASRYKLPPPRVEDSEIDLREQIEQLHFKLECAEKRATASGERARLYARMYRVWRGRAERAESP